MEKIFIIIMAAFLCSQTLNAQTTCSWKVFVGEKYITSLMQKDSVTINLNQFVNADSLTFYYQLTKHRDLQIVMIVMDTFRRELIRKQIENGKCIFSLNELAMLSKKQTINFYTITTPLNRKSQVRVGTVMIAKGEWKNKY